MENRRIESVLGHLMVAAGLITVVGPGSASAQTPAFVQVNYATPSSATTVTVPFQSAQTAGNLSVVIVGWGDVTRTVQSVTDTTGNTYVRAVGPTVLGGTATQSIYYAKSIAAAAANANSVRVTFSGAAVYPDVRIAEYRGLDQANPLDVAVGASSGSSTTSNSGPVTTTNANDLLVAGNYVLGTTTGAGSGFTSRVITQPDGDILMDRAVTTTGTYSATAPETSGAWIMQMVAFRAGGGAPTTPAITSLSPSSGPVGTSVTITGSNFGGSQGASTVRFNGTLASPGSWSASSIAVPVPAGATTGSVVVNVAGVNSNGPTFTVTVPPPTPAITSLSPSSGPVGTSVTITGSNFGGSQGASTVRFNGTLASPGSWSASSIVVPVPAGATTGSVVVNVGGVNSNGQTFTVTSSAPTITSLSPSSGPVGTSVTITGSNFGGSQGASTVRFNGTLASPGSWSASSIVVPVPAGATTGSVVVNVGGVNSNGQTFTVTSSAPTITSLSPSSGPVGTSVTITGSNFGGSQGASTVRFNGTLASPGSWSASSIVVPVPAGATTGSVVVNVGGVNSNGQTFTVTTPAPTITSLSPSSGPVGTSVTITGSNFGATRGVSTVRFNGTLASPGSWSTNSIVVPVPAGATTGSVVVNVGGVNSNGQTFTVTTTGPPSATPGLVQQLLVQSNQNFESGNGFINALPNPVLNGNCVILALTYARKPGRTVAISDNIGTNNWSLAAGPFNDPGGTFSSAIYVSLNTKAGTQRITVTFDAPLDDFQAVASEWHNVATVGALDGSAAASARAPNVAAGTITTTQSGDLVYQYAIDTGWGVAMEGNSFTGYAAGAGFTLLAADRRIAVVHQSAIQSAGGPINPTFTTTGGTGDSFNTLAIALKAASAGTAPDPTAMRIVTTYHTRVNAGSPRLNFPTRGNLFVATTAYHEGQETLQGVSDSNGNQWSVVTGSSDPQMAYARNATPGSNLVLTLNVAEHGSGNLQLLIHDVVNADPNPYVKVAYASGSAGTGNPVVPNAPTLTPAAAGGVVFASLNLYTGPPASMTSPAGVVFDSIYYAGATDLTPQDSGDGYAHVYSTSTAPMSFNWQLANGSHSTGWSAAAWEFKRAPGSLPEASASPTAPSERVDAPRPARTPNVGADERPVTVAGVLTYRNDAARTGRNTQEYALSPRTVSARTFGALFSCAVDGAVRAQPLYVPSVDVAGKVRNVLIVATQNDFVYAFDADDPSCVEIWSRRFAGPGVTSVTGKADAPSIGITATPVIDPATRTVYVQAETMETVGAECSTMTPCDVHSLHALDLLTGAETLGGPVTIEAPGFTAGQQSARSALLSHQTLYLGFGQRPEFGTGQGWVFGFDPATLASTLAVPTTDPGSAGNAVWRGESVAADANGNVWSGDSAALPKAAWWNGNASSLSAHGTSDAIVWTLGQVAGTTVLRAYDATNRLLYRSPVEGPGAAPPAVTFAVPTIANGKVYVGGQDAFGVFGLLRD